ncbi:GreA/GreB family elongation factor [Pseudomonas sp. DTU_2021_1001937_2_SI_NGA_ILE_001]|uniref:GreA/GreB family elongation factor n=1 Tax=Pseudomonas sp. DTU_2021_1001937_2_SI_NGA_ILE_001 TaxID=3077589 RepID=UPI0025F14F03|nr:GreA/GreB family elongation factor [Pseudomonas sp. DTU_2021_1001937_2_SI_NGA_ILE_001]WNW11977.1 GreA/GreB family elongation factor [Pseudomonas sp. DTU_2021_1001937_2_SI_NGA_ILE_001]
MSRAFVNEDNNAQQTSQPVERRVSEQPNYVTAHGLVLLQGQVRELQARHREQSGLGDKADKQSLVDIERDLRYYTQRLQSAQVVTPALSTDKVQIGSWVTYADEDDVHHRVQLVGEDQADAAHGLINWGSPLGRALLGARPGDEVLWKRPAGERLIEVLDIEADPGT